MLSRRKKCVSKGGSGDGIFAWSAAHDWSATIRNPSWPEDDREWTPGRFAVFLHVLYSRPRDQRRPALKSQMQLQVSKWVARPENALLTTPQRFRSG